MSLETKPIETLVPDDEPDIPLDDAADAPEPQTGDDPEALPPVLIAKCEACRVAVQYRPTPSGNGFTTVAVLGVAADILPHMGSNGRPACPKCNGLMEAHEPEPASEAIAHAAAQLAPREPELPFPFNYPAALSAIVEKNLDVQRLRDKYDALKKKAASAKKDLDDEEAGLGALIREMEERRQKAEHPEDEQPSLLEAVAPDAPARTAAPVCPWERAHPGEECHVCRKDAAVSPETQAEHDEAEGAEQVGYLADLVFRAFGRFLTIEVVAGWTAEQRAEATTVANQQLALEESGTIGEGMVLNLPEFFGAAHVAGEPPESDGQEAQHCQVCGAVINPPMSTREARSYYSPGALVGTDCPGEMGIQPAAPVPETPEPARQLPRRGSRKAKA